ncbi:hypothetical protein [Streptomyces sp. NPDC006784]|uniref:hypothetical protein n=1 Tax=Streptomyces sp. NPDC006784 TaxID=3364764 RepID=UPI0036A3F53E
MRKRTWTAALGTVLVLGGIAGAVPAQAAASGASLTGTAPACIQRSVSNIPDGGIHGYLRNTCGKTMRVKVVVKYWRDTSCMTIRNNTSKYVHTVGGRYDRTVTC